MASLHLNGHQGSPRPLDRSNHIWALHFLLRPSSSITTSPMSTSPNRDGPYTWQCLPVLTVLPRLQNSDAGF